MRCCTKKEVVRRVLWNEVLYEGEFREGLWRMNRSMKKLKQE